MDMEKNPLLEAWRSMMQQWETSANKTLTEATSTKESAALLNGTLQGALQMQTAFTTAMEKYLTTLNLPTRNDVLQLSQQIKELERKVDALRSYDDRDPGSQPSLRPKPARTRQVSAV